MKFCSMNASTEPDVENLLMSPCWNSAPNATQEAYLLDSHKLLLDAELEPLTSDANQKNPLEVLDNILLNSSTLNPLPELKPLPPFTGYTSHLSINGISGHHYHAIAQRLPPEENNNNYMTSAYQINSLTSATTTLSGTPIQLTTTSSSLTSSNNNTLTAASLALPNSNNQSSSHDQNIVSSSTCLNESVLNGNNNNACLSDIKLFSGNQIDNKLYSLTGSSVMSTGSQSSGITANATTTSMVCQGSDPGGVRIFTDGKDLAEYVDMSSIDDIAAIIGNAIADTAVLNTGAREDTADTRDSWMDIDAWIDGNCIEHDGKLVLQQQDLLNEFILPQSPVHSNSTTLQSLLSQGYMPLLQNRLQHGAATTTIKKETPSSTSFPSNELRTPTSSSASPPNSVVSTTDNILISSGYMHNPQPYRMSVSSLKSEGIFNSDALNNFPHTTTNTPKSKRSRSQRKGTNNIMQNQCNNLHDETHKPKSSSTSSHQINAISSPTSLPYSSSDLTGLLGKEKPVHRCNICNRGFLNKSNIKVHLRTHTGEKPFRCEVCAKAFRQKAHLLKHQQIHKRIGRD